MSIFRRAVHLSAPPPRRGTGRVLVHPPPRRARRPPPPHTVAERASPSVAELDRFNAPLYTLKAFAIATAIVLTSATASVMGTMAYLDVRNTAEFAARMQTWVSLSMPLLSTKIYRRPTPVDDDPVLLAASTPQDESSTPPIFDHDTAQQRLAEAFDKGVIDGWVEAAAREMEAEMEVERARRSKTT